MELLYDNTNLSIILFTRDRFALSTLQTDNNNDVLIRHIEIFSNSSLVKTDYFIFDKASSNFIILSISQIKPRLEISNLVSTKKKPWRSAPRFFCFQSDARLRGEGMETK